MQVPREGSGRVREGHRPEEGRAAQCACTCLRRRRSGRGSGRPEQGDDRLGVYGHIML